MGKHIASVNNRKENNSQVLCIHDIYNEKEVLFVSRVFACQEFRCIDDGTAQPFKTSPFNLLVWQNYPGNSGSSRINGGLSFSHRSCF